MSHQGCSHLRNVLDGEKLSEVAVAAARRLAGLEFDAIAFRGMSGAIVAPVVASMLHKKLILVRKPGDNDNHSGHKVEGPYHGELKYIIIDDLICSGATARAIIRDIFLHLSKDHTCVGMYTFAQEYEGEWHVTLPNERVLSFQRMGNNDYNPQ